MCILTKEERLSQLILGLVGNLDLDCQSGKGLGCHSLLTSTIAAVRATITSCLDGCPGVAQNNVLTGLPVSLLNPSSCSLFAWQQPSDPVKIVSTTLFKTLCWIPFHSVKPKALAWLGTALPAFLLAPSSDSCTTPIPCAICAWPPFRTSTHQTLPLPTPSPRAVPSA